MSTHASAATERAMDIAADSARRAAGDSANESDVGSDDSMDTGSEGSADSCAYMAASTRSDRKSAPSASGEKGSAPPSARSSVRPERASRERVTCPRRRDENGRCSSACNLAASISAFGGKMSMMMYSPCKRTCDEDADFTKKREGRKRD
eukprot:3275471-Pleurochrysis_carterae.AAC.2